MSPVLSKEKRVLREIPCADCEFVIQYDGTWLHNATPIGRPELVKLFASVLCRDEKGQYWLQTPIEKVRVKVEDAPFLAVKMDINGIGKKQEVAFETNTGARVVAGDGGGLYLRPNKLSGHMAPYLDLGNGMEARLLTSVYYELAEYAAQVMDDQGRCVYGIWSCQHFFPLMSEERTA